MTDDMDAALDKALRQFYSDMLVARTMRTEKSQQHWTESAVKRAVEKIKSLYRDGPPENTSPFQRVTRHLGLLNGAGGECGTGEGQPQDGDRPALRLVE
jgi:hypothetical protein